MEGAEQAQHIQGTEEGQCMTGTVVINEVGEEALAIMAEMGSALKCKHEVNSGSDPPVDGCAPIHPPDPKDRGLALNNNHWADYGSGPVV